MVTCIKLQRSLGNTVELDRHVPGWNSEVLSWKGRVNVGAQLIVSYLPSQDSSACCHWIFCGDNGFKKSKIKWGEWGWQYFFWEMRNTFIFNTLILNWKWRGILKQLFSASSPGTFGGSRDHYQGFFKIKAIFLLIIRHHLLFFILLSLRSMQWRFPKATWYVWNLCFEG